MNILIPALAGLGLVIFTCGLPALNPRRLSARVDPFLNGLAGRPSSLLGVGPSGGVAWRERIHRTFGRFGLSGSSELAHRLLSAGSERDPQAFRFDQLLWSAVGACCAAAVVAVALFSARPDAASMCLLIPLAAATGWVAKDRSLSRAVSRRRERTRQELPVALDLLTLAVMAGESVPRAFERVAAMSGGEVGNELERVVASIRAGAPIGDVLQDLPARLPDPAVGRLVDALCTGIERGAPLADTLRTQADDLRQASRRELLESGGRREILMLLPVVFLILPTVVAFTLLPGLVALDLLVP
jgi:tight adherence protein C